MFVEELSEADRVAAIALWAEVALTRPWNDAEADFQRSVQGSTSVVLGVRDEGEIIGTVMVGFDGHRGWVYYLAVKAPRQREGLGRLLMTAAEDWLRAMGATKIQLMVRRENATAVSFYERISYKEEPVVLLSHWLNASA